MMKKLSFQINKMFYNGTHNGVLTNEIFLLDL